MTDVAGNDQGDVIRSADNATLKLIRSLRKRSVREAERAFVVEGTRAVADALDAGGNSRTILVRAGDVNLPGWLEGRSDTRNVEAGLFNRHSETETPQSVMAIFAQPVIPITQSAQPLYLVTDGIRDPGNMGTLLRSAAAAGVTAVLVTPETVDVYNGKVVRAGMGAHFRVPIRALDQEWCERVASTCDVRIVADANAALTYDRVDWHRGVALIIGSEAHGPSLSTRELANTAARIPLANGVESLNAGVAGSVMLFEARRQRSI